MNYKKIYEDLIHRAKHRKLDGYKEVHHIIPKCLNGSDLEDNLVELTAREHFIAHMILVKIYPGHHGLIKAVVMMCMGQNERKLNNRIYEWIRIKFSEAQSINQSGTNNSQYGTIWIHNPETYESKKIKNGDMLNDGWILGRYKKPKSPKINLKKIERIERNQQLYNEYYKLYVQYGFIKFVEITGYDKTKQNLVQCFAKYVKDFIPQNGKKR